MNRFAEHEVEFFKRLRNDGQRVKSIAFGISALIIVGIFLFIPLTNFI
jgi:hypothetical protein